MRADFLCDDERVSKTIVIVDDHADFRAHVADLVASAGYEVVGSCPDGRSAVEAIATLRPHVVLLDVQLPDIDGFGVLERTRNRGETPIVILTSTREVADYGRRVARSGAAGFISKPDLSAQSLDRVVCRR